MPWLACHNPEIDWKTGEVKMTRCLEEYSKQWRPVQGKLCWKRQREEEVKEEAERKWEEREKRKPEEKRTVEVKRVAEEWKIWDEEEKAAKSEKEARKLVLEKFYQ